MLNDLDYADDIALLENTIPRANAQLNTLSAEARPVGLEINTDKTECMVICPASKADEFAEPLVLNNNQLARVKNFTYLGANMQSSFCDMSHRKGKAWAAFWSLKDIWRAKHIVVALKISIFKIAVLSVFFYGCETWILTRQMEKEIDGFGTNCLRIILGIKKLDKIPNELIYAQTGMLELSRLIKERQLRYLGHTLRIKGDCEPAKIFALYTPADNHGSRKRGGQKLRFADHIENLMPSACTVESIIADAQNRTKWRNVVEYQLKRKNDDDGQVKRVKSSKNT